MRIMFLLAAAALAFQTSGVQAQEACSSSYVSCIDKCAVRPTKTLQETCFESCQSQNRACSARFFGTPRGTEVVQQPAAADEALAAKDEASAAKTPAGKTPAAKTSAAKSPKSGKPAPRNNQ